MPPTQSPWRISIDTGGTFTDCLARDPEGRSHRAKVLSTSALRGVVEEQLEPCRLRVAVKWSCPADFVRGFTFHALERAAENRTVTGFDPRSRVLQLDSPLAGDVAAGAAFEVRSPEEAPVLAARLVTGTPLDAPLPAIEMRLATTRGTNALLERSGAEVALFITRGFGDLLEIGTQQRPDLFTLDIRKPPPLHAAVVEVRERVAAGGAVLEPLAPGELRRLAGEASALVARGVRSAAVTLLNGHSNPRHESEVADVLRAAGFEHVSVSSRLAPFEGLLHRAQTCVVNAYLAPRVGGYVARVHASIPGGRLHVMTSSGGLAGVESFEPKDSLLSGPAGGVCGAAIGGRRSGFSRVIAFDMGGTSTDVARFDEGFEYVFEHEVGGVRLVAPALAVESVAAGGGSICRFDGNGLGVGPESAGAFPGPACYGAGGPLTITDVNLLLGRLDAGRFEIPVRREPAEARLEELLASLRTATGEAPERDALLEGLLEIANERMAGAIRRVSAQKGFEPARFALVAFGGAGGQHACSVAERLEISTVIVPADAGLLSAIGLGRASIERFAARQVLAPLEGVSELVPGWIDALEREARSALEAEGVSLEDVEVRRRIASLRFAGQDSTVQVEVDGRTPLADAFRARYEATFGHAPERRPVELESLRVAAATRAAPDELPLAAPAAYEAVRRSRIRARVDGSWRDLPAFDRSALSPGARIDGPALILEDHGATLVEPGWSAEVDGAHAIVVRGNRSNRPGLSRRAASGGEAVRLELFTNRFRAIVEEMGEMLRRTAISTNVKERLDFSCALLDAGGELVVNAPHIPVHLGALGFCVRSLREVIAMDPGDVIVTNHPAFGGSHLPDITVVTPVHDAGGRLLAHVASRAHHAEIGGSVPGSMPPHATSLEEEGVVIAPAHLVKGGRADWETMRALLESGPHPSRAVEENLADLRAAVAANHHGRMAFAALAEREGADDVCSHMSRLKRFAETRMREALRKLPPGRREAEDLLDDGSRLRVTMDLRADSARIDFGGSSGAHAGNLNATPAIVRSVVLYVLRLLVDEPLPLNEGLLAPIEIIVPHGILNPRFPTDGSPAPAVFGGNVETSQRLAGLLIRALGLAASSQGTMNNVIFGAERFGYYETVCGGAGAGPTFDGASAVHTHMTNTRITDPEVIERRYPARVARFSLRRGSGGAGRHRGGDGVVRELELLAPMKLSVLGQHRTVGPAGLAGGGAGMPGAARVRRVSGETISLGASGGCDVGPGDRFELETPGGGGYGAR